MRSDWVPLSASALVIGVMALVFGSLLNPQEAGSTAAQTMATVGREGGRWLGMSVMYFGASVALTLGLPALLSLFTKRGRKLGLFAIAVFSIGVIGTSGYAMLLVFFRALVKAGALENSKLEQVTADNGLNIFLYGWIAGFYLGLLLIALALFVAKRTPTWVPVLLVVFVALFPFGEQIGRIGQVLQVMGLAVAFTGIAISAVNQVHERDVVGQTF
ncbi:MAG: hypothetical protein ACTHKG_05645 [Nocardioides sp.]